MDGFNVVDEDVLQVNLKLRPDFIITTLTPLLSLVTMLRGDGLEPFIQNVLKAVFGERDIGTISKTLGVQETDVILNFKFWKQRPLFAFLSAFDFKIWLFILMSAVALATAVSLKNIGEFGKYLEYVIYCLVATPRSKLIRSAPGLLITWIAAVWLLQQFYGGDMFSEVMAPPEADVIKSIEELFEAKNKTILILDTETFADDITMATLRNYFGAYPRDYVDDFVTRTESVSYNKRLQFPEQVEAFTNDIFRSTKKHHQVALCFRDWGLYVKNKVANGSFREHLYVSDSAGGVQPNFFISTFFAHAREVRAMDDVISRLTESGVYQRWVRYATFGWKDFEVKASLVEDSQATATILYGPGIFCLFCVVLTGLVLSFECRVFIKIRIRKAFKTLRLWYRILGLLFVQLWNLIRNQIALSVPSFVLCFRLFNRNLFGRRNRVFISRNYLQN